jgi:hypothetical protein
MFISSGLFAFISAFLPIFYSFNIHFPSSFLFLFSFTFSLSPHYFFPIFLPRGIGRYPSPFSERETGVSSNLVCERYTLATEQKILGEQKVLGWIVIALVHRHILSTNYYPNTTA